MIFTQVPRTLASASQCRLFTGLLLRRCLVSLASNPIPVPGDVFHAIKLGKYENNIFRATTETARKTHELELSVRALQDSKNLEHLQNVSLPTGYLCFLNTRAEDISTFLDHSGQITPTRLAFYDKCSISRRDWDALVTAETVKSLSIFHEPLDIQPEAPTLEETLKALSGASTVRLNVENMVIPENLNDVLLAWKRDTPLEHFSLYRVPENFDVDKFVQFVQTNFKQLDELYQITLSFDRDAKYEVVQEFVNNLHERFGQRPKRIDAIIWHRNQWYERRIGM